MVRRDRRREHTPITPGRFSERLGEQWCFNYDRAHECGYGGIPSHFAEHNDRGAYFERPPLEPEFA